MALVIELEKDGKCHIVAVDKGTELWQWTPNNPTTFPAVTAYPAKRSKPRAGRIWTESDHVRIQERFDRSMRVLSEETDGKLHESIKTLMKRIPKVDYDQLEKQICQWAKTNDKEAKIKEQFTVYFDLRESSKQKVRSHKTEQSLRTTLIEKEDAAPKSKEVDLFGNPFTGQEGPTMQVMQLGPQGRVGMRRNFWKSPHLKRYGLIDSASCPTSTISQNRIREAAEWLVDPDRRGQTWNDFPSIFPQKICLLFAYVAEQINAEVGITGILNGPESKEFKERDFATMTEDVVNILDKLNETEASNIQLFAIDLNNSKGSSHRVALSQKISVPEFNRAIAEWKEGSQNMPSPFKYIPAPRSMIYTSREVWEKSMKKYATTGLINLKECIEIFLFNNVHFTNMLLNSILQNKYWLATEYANRFNPNNNLNKTSHFKAREFMTMLAILLYKLGFRKDDYMTSIAFKIGRIFKSYADLQALYCEIVRNNSHPSNYVSSDFLAVALQRPQDALVMLHDRGTIYREWAKAYRNKKQDKSGLAGFLFFELSQLADSADIPESFTNAEKAMFWMGYLNIPRKNGNGEDPKEEQDKP
jgi:hypothetical protein